MQEFFLEVKEVDRNNEVNRILGAFKLNPFEQLGLPFDATQEEAKRQYRKLSLLIHPDKCKHPLATSAFEVLGNANSQLTNEDFMRELRHALNLARGMLPRLSLLLLSLGGVAHLVMLMHDLSLPFEARCLAR